MTDILIQNGLVIDGTGKDAFQGDVAVKDGKILAIGDLRGMTAKKVLNAEGMAVAPGFIDSHSHSDTSFLIDSSCASKLYQGITTEVCGQCGFSPFPKPKQGSDDPWECDSFASFIDQFEHSAYSMAVNQAMLVGHGALRQAVAGQEDRPITSFEMERMKMLLDRDLSDGAWGLSLGLEYSPGFFADEYELSELGSTAAEHDALVTAHMRSEGLQIDAAIDEILGIGQRSGARVHISHLKIDNFRVHGRAEAVWKKITEAQRRGIRISADMYPFTASSTGLTVRCPQWSQDGGDAAVVAYLQSERRGEILDSLRYHYFNAERAETCLFSDDAGLWPEIVGHTLREVAEEILHTADYAEAAAEVLVRTRGKADCVFFVMSEADMQYFLAQDVGIGSDGSAWPGDPAKVRSKPHPRAFGAISEFFRLRRELEFCSLEEAVRRVTSKAADMIGMRDRGRLAEGLAADITVFDPERIAPCASYLDPVRLAQGVCHVLVNGETALENGVQTEVRAGRFLRKKQ